MNTLLAQYGNDPSQTAAIADACAALGVEATVRPAGMLRPAELAAASVLLVSPMGVAPLAWLVTTALVWDIDLSRTVVVCIGPAAPLALDCLRAVGAGEVLAWERAPSPETIRAIVLKAVGRAGARALPR